MIKDGGRLIQLRSEWNGVRDRQEYFRRNVLFAFAEGALNMRNLADPIYSLLLLYAFATLQSVLMEIRDQGTFSSRGELGELFKGSKTILPWVDYDLVNEGRRMRNKIAHSNFILSSKESFRYIDAIEAEASWILDDNQPMRAVMETMGSDVYRRWRLYQKPIASA